MLPFMIYEIQRFLSLGDETGLKSEVVAEFKLPHTSPFFIRTFTVKESLKPIIQK